MLGRFPYQALAKYPHMKPEDVAVWERFIIKRPDIFATADYDVPVGTGAPTNPDHPEEMQRDHTILTQKKIDVVAYSGDNTFLIEVKPTADMRALGQILTYRKLWIADNPTARAPLCMVVCGKIERELDSIFADNGIELEVA